MLLFEDEHFAMQFKRCNNFYVFWWDTFTLEVPVAIQLTCDRAVADDAVMPIRAESSSWLLWWGSGVN